MRVFEIPVYKTEYKLKKECKNSIKREVTMTTGEANLYSLIFLIPLVLIIALPYYYIWPEQFTFDKLRSYLDAREMLTFIDISVGLLIMISGIVIHELLHGLGWSLYTKKGWKSIKFGVVWKYITPYCHCSEPLLLKPYKIGSVLPVIVLGIVPSILAIAIGNLWLILFGFFFTFAAGGDFLILWLLRNEYSASMVQDHPDKIGCIVYD